MEHLLVFYFNFYLNGQKRAADVPPRGGPLGERLAHGDVLANDAPVSMEYSKQNVRKKHIFQFHFGYIV